jgi:outer membrane receptor protein involved in Fe transport
MPRQSRPAALNFNAPTPLHAALIALCTAATSAAAQTTPTSPAPITQLPSVEVVSPSPLPGLGIARDRVPANVQTATGADLDRRRSLDLADHLNRTLGSVNVNALQGNPLQPDINFRGFTASPLLGTPQGLSVYLDGVRLNQPFGDVVSWDLLPRAAIASIALMPGSNPLFGLNTLGGALSVQTKDGIKHPGTSVQLSAGSHRRVALEFETGGSRADGLNWFVTGNRVHERVWRTTWPTDVTQLFGKLGGKVGDTEVTLSAAVADNRLSGNGLQEQAAAQRDRASVYTVPDQTRNRSLFLNLTAVNHLSDALTLSGNAYYRRIGTRTYNGDVSDASLTESVWQPNAAERDALTAAGYTGFPASGANAANTPFPKWRCIANALLNDEPNEQCNGLVNRTSTRQHNAGVGAQLSGDLALAGLGHRWLIGAALDASRMHFGQSAQFGYIEPDRSITAVGGAGAFADGTQNSENAFDARVDLASRSHTASVFASDTIALNSKTHLTIAGRYNRNRVTSVDAITPGGGPGSLDGRHTFARFNPALGLTFAPSTSLTLYAGANQGSRAPSAIELGCADPASPCKLPNSFSGDPPLAQVVTTTLEAGLRGSLGEGAGKWAWNLGAFRSDNRDDLLFVADDTSGFGYFKNFGKTRRQGIELGISGRVAEGLTVGANLSLLDATYRSAEVVGGASNSSNAAAAAGLPGTEGTIEIRPGDRIPLLPRRLAKLYADWAFAPQWRLGADLSASSGANARGNENGEHTPDGTYYTGAGRSAGYALLNMNVEYKPTPRLAVFVKVDNVLDRRYATGAQLGANAFDANGNFAARSLPVNANGDHPLRHGTFTAPGAPRAFGVGIRYTFDDS